MPQGQYSDADVQQAAAPVQHGQYTDADVLPEQSFAAGAKEAGHQIVSDVKGIWQTVRHPIDTAKAYLDAKGKMVDDAEAALSKGDWPGFLRHMQTAAIPVPGLDVAVENATNKWESGDKAGALGDAAALVAETAVAQKAPVIARGVKATGAGIAAAAPDVAAGGAKIVTGEALAKLPGMEFPARIGLGYPGARQIGKGMGKFGEAFSKSMAGPEVAPAEPGAPAAAAPATAKTPGQLLAEQDGKTWAKVPKPEKQLYETIATERAKGEANVAAEGPNIPKPPRDFAEHYGVTAPQQAAVPRETPPAAEVTPSPTPAAAPEPATPGPAAQPEPATVPEQLKTSGRTFIKDARPSAEDYTLMEVPTDEIDSRWAEPAGRENLYIRRGGGGAEIGGRLPKAKAFIETGQPIEAPRVYMQEGGRVDFEDGRHRFAAVRDAGDKTTAVMVPNEQVGQFEALNKPLTQPAAAARTPADIAKAAQAKAKGDRFVAAIQRYNIDFPDRQPITSKGLENLGDAEKSILTRQLKNGGYLKNTEEFTDTSFPYIVQGLKDAESGGNLAQQLAESIRRARANRASAGR